jgi:hypothetical protein
MIGELALESDNMAKAKDPVTWAQFAVLLILLGGMGYWYNQNLQTSINSLEKNINQRLDLLWNEVFTRRSGCWNKERPYQNRR